jgi:hypothetical protein
MAKEVGLRGRMDIAQFNKNVQSFVQSINLMNREVSRVAKESAAGAAEAGKAANLLGVNTSLLVFWLLTSFGRSVVV